MSESELYMYMYMYINLYVSIDVCLFSIEGFQPLQCATVACIYKERYRNRDKDRNRDGNVGVYKNIDLSVEENAVQATKNGCCRQYREFR